MGKAARNRAKRQAKGVKKAPIDFELQNAWNQEVLRMGEAAAEHKEKFKNKK